MDEILPNLFLGKQVYPASAAIQTPQLTARSLKALDDLPLLRAIGITHILSITSSKLPPILPTTGLVHKHLVVSDVRTQNFLRYALDGIQYLEDAYLGIVPPIDPSEEPKVFVHCRMGISRSASVVIAYRTFFFSEHFPTEINPTAVMKHNIPSFPDAMAFVKERRPIVYPNRGFRTQIAFLGDAGFDISHLPELEDMNIMNPYDPEEEDAPRRTARRRPPPPIPAQIQAASTALAQPWESNPSGWVPLVMTDAGLQVVREVCSGLDTRD